MTVSKGIIDACKKQQQSYLDPMSAYNMTVVFYPFPGPQCSFR
jgi:hypothetical protein